MVVKSQEIHHGMFFCKNHWDKLKTSATHVNQWINNDSYRCITLSKRVWMLHFEVIVIK